MGADLGLGWIPVRTAAKMMGVSRSRVYQLVDAGDLKALRQDRTWLVHRASVDLWCEIRDRRKRRAA